MRLTWHNYRYYPYERELAVREATSLLRPASWSEVLEGLDLPGEDDNASAVRLTYFAGVANGHCMTETLQSRLERTARHRNGRQVTRYSVHGLHEYKGKFNPQVVRALLNILGITPGQRVLDPFCGSGTTLVECSHIGALGYGIDLNPFAIFLANAKLQALSTAANDLWAILRELSSFLNRSWSQNTLLRGDLRSLYLQSWFDPGILQGFEMIRESIERIAGASSPAFLAIASNLLRNYSLQDPMDLRIRRRKSPLPLTPVPDAFEAACSQAIGHIEATQAVLGTDLSRSQAVVLDATNIPSASPPILFDASITSPPYAMALPYIDTQRLSLVWLNLIEPSSIPSLEAELIGSREFRGPARRRLVAALDRNDDHLPESEVTFCRKLLRALDEQDGFRRQAVPVLLYRYFASMRQSFQSIRRVMRPRAPFALIVGHNHSVLGGVKYNIDTPSHLASIASSVGWIVEELMPLQTYHRYGYHMSNAVGAETLVLLRKP